MVRFKVLALNNFQAKDIWDNDKKKSDIFGRKLYEGNFTKKSLTPDFLIFWLCGLCGKRSEFNQSLGMKILDVGKIP